jgi:hypothetical protein
MTLGNMRQQGVQHLIAYCHNDACRHHDHRRVEIPRRCRFQGHIKCGKCGRKGRWVDVRPNWKEKVGMPDNWQGRPA